MPWTNVQLVLNSRDKTSGQYNSSLFNAVNQNLVQGQVHSVSVNELNFPYDIPNIQTGFNYFIVDTNFFLGRTMDIVVPPGFYSGTELASAINGLIDIAGAALITPLTPTQLPKVAFSTTTNLFTFSPPTAPLDSTYNDWFLQSPYTFGADYGLTTVPTNTIGKDILSIMGYVNGQDNKFSVTPLKLLVSGSAPLVFTQYIDICSPELCQYQYFRDGSTTNLARRADVICRLYISNNVATQEPEGQRPFVINRQFNNARVMRWSAESSIGSMSIQLYDDVGQPLLTTWNPRPYQITLNVYEQDKDSITY